MKKGISFKLVLTQLTTTLQFFRVFPNVEHLKRNLIHALNDGIQNDYAERFIALIDQQQALISSTQGLLNLIDEVLNISSMVFMVNQDNLSAHLISMHQELQQHHSFFETMTQMNRLMNEDTQEACESLNRSSQSSVSAQGLFAGSPSMRKDAPCLTSSGDDKSMCTFKITATPVGPK